MERRVSVILLFFYFFFQISFKVEAKKSLAVPSLPYPRKILALYDGTVSKDPFDTIIHRIAEMPLNHLGLMVEYVDINQGLPLIEDMQDVLGVFTWFEKNYMVDPLSYLSWGEKVIDSGKKFVIFGDPGVSEDIKGQKITLNSLNRFLGKLGLQSKNNWSHVTYDVNFVFKDSYLVEFERPLSSVMPPFEQIIINDKRVKSFLTVQHDNRAETKSHLITIGPNGGYAAGGYIYFFQDKYNRYQLYLNLFKFFRQAFKTDNFPKAEVNTLSGRRIYYSHIDGDGWRNVSEIEKYRKNKILSSEVILEEVIKEFPDLPVTVAPVIGDLDPNWYGTKKSLEIAKKILSMPNVEVATHTYSHPLNWNFFADGNLEKERNLLKIFEKISKKKDIDFEPPRNYFVKPFDIDLEIVGSIQFLKNIIPPGKQVGLVQWSGDTKPFEKAIALSRSAGLRNINGGDSRFDREYSSYVWVSPLGRKVGNQVQIFSSNSNENTYTDLWKDRFFAFQHLIKTIRNTETPWRIKPFNVYYHMYSGEKISSLKAILDNLRFARTQEIIPITTSDYAAIADGFYSAQLFPLKKDKWMIKNRGDLQTVRFDHGTHLAIDFSNSIGIIGQRHYQGSLYVALDSTVDAPVIALRNNPDYFEVPKTKQSYLIQSSWKISNFTIKDKKFGFKAEGYGDGVMSWQVKQKGKYLIEIADNNGYRKVKTSSTQEGNNILPIKITPGFFGPVNVIVTSLE